MYIHPTPSSKDNVPGFIALIQQKSPATDDRPTSSSSSTSTSKREKATSYLLAWLPESSLGDAYDSYVKVELSDASSPPEQTPLVPQPPTTTTHTNSIGHYAFAIPVSEIYSLLIRPPALGWWFGSVVINTRAGNSFPALFFHDDECQSTILQKKKLVRETFDPFGEGGGTFWGGDEVLKWLKRYVTVEKSGADPSVYLIEPSAEDKLGFGSGKQSATSSPKLGAKAVGPMAIGGSSPSNSSRDAGMDPVTKALKQARWSFLEKMSQVTNFTRRTAENIVENPKVPPQMRRLMKNPEVQTLQDEFDSARVYLARWAMGIAEQSEKERSQRIFTAQDILDLEDTDVGEFELLDMEAGNMSLREKRQPVSMKEWNGFFDAQTGRLLVTVDEVKERIFLGGLNSSDGVRKEAWLFLLGVYDWDSTVDERRAVMNSKRDEFVRLKGAWWERMVDGSGNAEETEWWKEQKGRIGTYPRRVEMSGLNRLTYPIAGDSAYRERRPSHRSSHTAFRRGRHTASRPRLTIRGSRDQRPPRADEGHASYLQRVQPGPRLCPGHERFISADVRCRARRCRRVLGLRTFYAANGEISQSFYSTRQAHEVVKERNFLRDQSGMRTQLLTLDHLVQLMDPALYLHLQSADSTNFFFFFRMLLVWYKREFGWADVLRLWESLWTDYLSSNFHLFIALAILEKHRDVIMEHLKRFDEVLKYVNELSNTIDLPSTLLRAESLFRRFQRTVEAVDKRNNFPAPTVRQRKPGDNPPKSSPLSSGAAASGTDRRRPASSSSEANGAKVKEKVISPELRQLLSRKVEVLDKKERAEHGGGIGV